MSDEELQEIRNLENQINSLVNLINRTVDENNILAEELEVSINNVHTLVKSCSILDGEVYNDMDHLSQKVGEAEIDALEVFNALNELTLQYFTFKSISTASKNMSQFTDEYYTSFSYYNDLRRISLGYVIGLDAHIISSDSARKRVEKAYLQNTDYWLAYAISAVMLWASDEKEAAERAMSKSLSINYFNTCLFFLLINLRFDRIEAAKKWYVNYLERADMNNLGDEWQYLLQAYLAGAFGGNPEFQEQISTCFRNMLAQVEVTNVNYGKRFSDTSLMFAQHFLHKSENEYSYLKSASPQYSDLMNLLSSAEKNAKIAKYYNTLAETGAEEGEDLPQRIENVLYSLVNNYDEDELKLVKKLKYNEAVVAAKGDVSAAQAKFNTMFHDSSKNTLGDMLVDWAFDDDTTQTSIVVRRFTISFMKDWIADGLSRFAESYKKNEPEKVSMNIDGCILTCNEDEFESLKPTLEKHYVQNKWKDVLKDKYILIYCAICAVALVILIIMPFHFNEIALTIAIILGVGGAFLLWRRIVDMGKILLEKKRLGVVRFKNILDDLRKWRIDYKDADAKHTDMMNAIDRFC